MGSLDKAKSVIDWARRIEFLVRMVGLIFAGFAGVTAKAIIVSFTHIPDVWRLPIYLLASLLALTAFAIGVQMWNRKGRHSDSDATQVLRDVKLQGARAILLSVMATEATYLMELLEEVWHHWDNLGEKLVHPLDARIDKMKDYSSDGVMKLVYEHRDFLVLYAHHLRTLATELPKFASPVVVTGYPSDCEYHRVLANLRVHIENLKTESQTAWDEY